MKKQAKVPFTAAAALIEGGWQKVPLAEFAVAGAYCRRVALAWNIIRESGNGMAVSLRLKKVAEEILFRELRGRKE